MIAVIQHGCGLRVGVGTTVHIHPLSVHITIVAWAKSERCFQTTNENLLWCIRDKSDLKGKSKFWCSRWHFFIKLPKDIRAALSANLLGFYRLGCLPLFLSLYRYTSLCFTLAYCITRLSADSISIVNDLHFLSCWCYWYCWCSSYKMHM